MARAGANIDKPGLYGRFQAAEDQQQEHNRNRQRLYIKAAHKALNLPLDVDPDDMQNVGNSYGATWREMLVGLAAAGAIAAGAAWYTGQEASPAAPAMEDTDTQRTIEFID